MKLNVAITMNVQRDATQSIWYNGANRHCVYLYMLLKQSPLIGEIGGGGGGVQLGDNRMATTSQCLHPAA
ncbi:hypothetical protein BW23_5656 [Burkholderia ubonensis MSMB22]|nr:hypothetical protein BW23_5656 [Burkholderia ubonensis MSMB22]